MELNSLTLAIGVCSIMSMVAAHANSDVVELPTMVFSASLKQQNPIKAPASISVIKAEDIQRSGAVSVAEVLQQQVGVSNYNTGQDKIIIRGMRDTSGSYTLILLNGKRTSSLGAMWRGNDFDWSSIPMNSIERIEVIRGPMSSLYGSDAMGGVINIITKAPKAGEIHTSVFGQYNYLDSGDGRNQYSSGVNIQGGLTDQVSISLSGTVNHRDAWYKDGKKDSKSFAYFQEKETKNLASTLTYKANNQQSIDLDLLYNNDKRPYVQDGSNSFSQMQMERSNIGLTHRGKWVWGKTEVYAGKETAIIHDYDSEYDTPQARKYRQDNWIGRVFTNFDWLNHNTSVGADYKNQKITDQVAYINNGTNEQRSYGIFAQNDTRLTKDLTLTLGGRYDGYNNFDGNFTGKAYLVYELTKGVVLKGGWGQAYKVPGPYQLDYNYRFVSCGGSCHIAGNPNLKAEESNNYEISLLANQPNWNAGITLYQNNVDNLIDRVTDTESTNPDLPNKWDNINKAQLKGIELTGGYHFNDQVSIKSNAAYLNAKDKTTGKSLTERPEWTMNNTLSWEITPQFTTNLGTNYIGHQTTYSGRELPTYTTYDATFNSVLSKKLTLDYGIKNLTNIDLTQEDVGFNTKLYGRNYFVKATYNF